MCPPSREEQNAWPIDYVSSEGGALLTGCRLPAGQKRNLLRVSVVRFGCGSPPLWEFHAIALISHLEHGGHGLVRTSASHSGATEQEEHNAPDEKKLEPIIPNYPDDGDDQSEEIWFPKDDLVF